MSHNPITSGWLLSLADKHPHIKGVVAGLDLTSQEVGSDSSLSLILVCNFKWNSSELHSPPLREMRHTHLCVSRLAASGSLDSEMVG